MLMSSRDQFEQAYADANSVPVPFVTLCLQGDSYSVPKVSRAWFWWQRGKEAA
jgi:hypothetical protein